MIFYEAGIKPLSTDKTNKMKAAKKFFTRVALTMIAIFVFESIYNWNESRLLYESL
jgi:membrane protein required for beta-lactamase induction